MTARAPERWDAGAVWARRIGPADLDCLRPLMADPEGLRRGPAPAQMAAGFARDLDHWQRHGFGRWVVLHGDRPVGLCGVTHQTGFPGLNISCYLSPAVRGRGWATDLAAALVDLTEAQGLTPYLHALLRAADPAPIRLLDKLAFRDLGRVQHDSSESLLRVRTFRGTAPMVYFGGPWQPIVSETPEGLIYSLPVSSGPVDFSVDLPISARDLGVLRADPDRASLAFAVLHPMGQALRATGETAEMAAALHHVVQADRADLLPWLAARDKACNGEISNHLSITCGADMAKLRRGAWLPLPRPDGTSA
ncbi:GNAT family N-acetyltransferase [Roseicyclus mahoneyensis]|uniref:RimJ/RimL family protein N-acetyltransferase n=1 Tax=Roseicyclus mahoneyensis TaxID=164332 RepID=A0A316GBT4_9RHOB|nr:GNAT family N-acetyltransferase [Roseicyclus mahoneyensis]PWK58063.1 RimJ/RimL family protein N-acetyltransferase [Roseicyclus mahoneyensis]